MAKTEIKSEISLSTTKFQRSLARTQTGINSFAKNAIAKFGAIAGVGGLGMLARSAIDLGSKISDMAVQMNIGTTQLQVLDFAAREAGVGTEILARALRNAQLRTEEAIKGNKSYGDAFKMLNIDINEFRKLPTEKKLEAIAVAQSKATDQAAAYNAVSRILGEKAGPALQEVLQNLAGPKGYGGLEAAAKRANEVMGEETVKAMDEAADTIESFKRQVVVATGGILSALFTFRDESATVFDEPRNLARFLKSYFNLKSAVERTSPVVEELAETTDNAAEAQGEFSEKTDVVTDSINDQAEATKTLTEQIKEYFTAAQKSADLDRETFVNSKKLEVLRLRAKGEKKAADELEDRVKSMEKAIDISNKYGISLREAANMVENINQAEAAGATSAGSSGGGGGGGSSSTSSFDVADKNKSGMVTGREQRAQETADRKAATDARRARTLEVARESGAGERTRDEARNQRFDSREAASGLNLAGNDPTASRKPIEEETKKQTEALETIGKTLAKLDSALGSE